MQFIKSYNPTPLAIFVTAEVLLYGSGLPVFDFIVALCTYGFILLSFLNNSQTGTLYLISFNILSIGYGNYWGNDTQLYTYWGLRIGPFSANILFTIILFWIICIHKKLRNLFPSDPYTKFFLIFFNVGFIVGTTMTLFGVNYIDNYIADFLVFFTVILYIVLCKDLTLEELKQVIRYSLPLAVYSLLWAYLLGRKFVYSEEEFLVSSAFASLSPIAVLIMNEYMSKQSKILYVAIILFLLATFSILLGGKLIISFILLFLWLAFRKKKLRYVNLTLIIICVPIFVLSLDFLADIASDKSGIATFKISQVLALFSNPDILKIAAEHSSLGNIIAETITLFTFLYREPIFLIVGKGFGGGIPDLFGFLTPFAGASGYSEIDAQRDNFFNLHIAPLKVLINGGVFIFIYYVKILIDILKQWTPISFLAFLQMVFYFYVYKEALLLTYVLLRIVYLSRIDNARGTGQNNSQNYQPSIETLSKILGK